MCLPRPAAATDLKLPQVVILSGLHNRTNNLAASARYLQNRKIDLLPGKLGSHVLQVKCASTAQWEPAPNPRSFKACRARSGRACSVHHSLWPFFSSWETGTNRERPLSLDSSPPLLAPSMVTRTFSLCCGTGRGGAIGGSCLARSEGTMSDSLNISAGQRIHCSSTDLH